MSGNAEATKKDRVPGTLEGILPGESLDDFERRVGDDIPELTDEDFARARPIDDFPELKAALENARGKRGPQRTPTKERVALRLDQNIVDHFRHDGPGWQTRINDALAEFVKRTAR